MTSATPSTAQNTLPKDHIWTRKEIQELLDTQVQYRDWKFLVQETMIEGILLDLHLRAEWYAPDNVTGAMEKQSSRWWRLSKHMRKNEIINTAFACVKMAEEHEMRENFLYRLGENWTMPYNTHTNVDELAAASVVVDVRTDNRPNAPENQRRD
jgi:hypothetical protein